MDTGMTAIVFVIGAILTAFVTTIFAIWDYELYKCVFGHGCYRKGTSITDKAWFRALMTPLIYFPVLNVVGLIILLYMRAMKELDIN
jgi:hypothetical protein